MENPSSLKNIKENLHEIYNRNNNQRFLDWKVNKNQNEELNRIIQNTRKLVRIKKKYIAINEISLRLEEDTRPKRTIEHRKIKIRKKIVYFYHLSIQFFFNIYESLKKLHKYTEDHNNILVKSKEFNQYQIELLERLLKQEHEEFQEQEQELKEKKGSLKEREEKAKTLVKLTELKEKLLKKNYNKELTRLENQEEQTIKEVAKLIEDTSKKLSSLAKLEKKAIASKESFETTIHKMNDIKITSEEFIDKIRGVAWAVYTSQKTKFERRRVNDKIHYNSNELLKLVKKEPNKIESIKEKITDNIRRLRYDLRKKVEDYNYNKVMKKLEKSTL